MSPTAKKSGGGASSPSGGSMMPLPGAEAAASKRAGKMSKLARMNEQERVKYLERKMAEEEESKRRKEDMVVNFMKLKLKGEDHYFSINNAKLIDSWRSLLREVKTGDLRNDVKVLMDAFARENERKNTHIRVLIKELDESEDQYNHAFRSHIEIMGKLDDIHCARITHLLRKHEDNIRITTDTSTKLADDSQSKQDTAETFLGDVTIATEQAHVNKTDKIKSAHQQHKDDVRNKILEDKQATQMQLEETMESLWQRLQTSVVEARASTEEKLRIYNELLAKDKKGSVEVAENSKKIAKLTSDSARLKESLSELKEQEERRLRGLRLELDELGTRLGETRTALASPASPAAASGHSVSAHSDLKDVAVMADRLQKRVAQVELLQSKLNSLLDNCSSHPAHSDLHWQLMAKHASAPQKQDDDPDGSGSVDAPPETSVLHRAHGELLLQREQLLRLKRALASECQHWKSAVKRSIAGATHSGRPF